MKTIFVSDTERENRELRRRLANAENRIALVRDLMRHLKVLPDAGKHADHECHRYHRDCLVVKTLRILDRQ